MQLHAEGVPYTEMAILYRNHSQVEILTKYFKAHGSPFNSKRRINIFDKRLLIFSKKIEFQFFENFYKINISFKKGKKLHFTEIIKLFI